jgi:hypothetical protein
LVVCSICRAYGAKSLQLASKSLGRSAMASLPVYFLCEAELAAVDWFCGYCGARCSWFKTTCWNCDRPRPPLFSGLHNLVHKSSRSADCRTALGGNAGGRRATALRLRCLVRAARAEGQALRPLRGVLDAAFPENRVALLLAARPALPLVPATSEARAC